MFEGYVLVQSFSGAIAARIIVSRLEAEGIDCFLQDELTVQTNWYLSNAVGGVKLFVKEEQVANALQLIKEGGYGDQFDENLLLDENEHVNCPKCGSDKIHRRELNKTAIGLSLLLFGLPLIFISKKYECENCGHTWPANK